MLIAHCSKTFTNTKEAHIYTYFVITYVHYDKLGAVFRILIILMQIRIHGVNFLSNIFENFIFF